LLFKKSNVVATSGFRPDFVHVANIFEIDKRDALLARTPAAIVNLVKSRRQYAFMCFLKGVNETIAKHLGEEAFFLEAISNGDQTASLIYSDWLEERGRYGHAKATREGEYVHWRVVVLRGSWLTETSEVDAKTRRLRVIIDGTFAFEQKSQVVPRPMPVF